MGEQPVAVIGAGIGGLSAALALAARGIPVEVLERAGTAGGKMRRIEVGGRGVDSGPTVLTLRRVFEEIFAEAGATLEERVALQPLDILARHAWPGGHRLDLYADRHRSAAAIAELAGPAEGRRFLAFCAEAAAVYRTLEQPFLRAQRPDPLRLTARVMARAPTGLLHIRPFTRLWQALGRHFRDPRLRQLFGRYATYCGSSPYLAPATLMLVAHVECEGIWRVSGGMQGLATALQSLAEARGVRFRFGCGVRGIGCRGGRASHLLLEDGGQLACRAVICNADPAALGAGLLGPAARRALVEPVRARSLSALTWSMDAATDGFPLVHHNVFFSADYREEFDDILKLRRVPRDPTVYLCAQDRGDGAPPAAMQGERLFCLVNAPATGDTNPFDEEEIERCATRTFRALEQMGLRIQRSPQRTVVTTPADFERRFPGTGGALYGAPSHGWRATFRRPGARTRLPGLYLAGGGTHPGPGLPMAALSGRLAVQSLLQDGISRRR